MTEDYIVANSICDGNTTANAFGPFASSAVIANNMGC